MFLIFALFTCLFVQSAAAATIDVDVAQRYGGVSIASINRGIADARVRFRDHPDDRVVLHLPAGRFVLSMTDESDASIDVSRLHPGAGGRLVLQGEGQARTTLVFDTHRDEIVGRDSNHVSFVGLHFTLPTMTVTQGRVEDLQAGAVVLRIAEGFPSPDALSQADARAGRYLRRCVGSPLSPAFDETDNVQVPWSDPQSLGGGLWRLAIRGRDGAEFHRGDLLAVKSKHGDGSAYRFIGGSDIVFDDVLWTRSTRGVFRGGASGIRILNSAIARDPAVAGVAPCLASAAGGPQIGQPRDPPTSGDVVENFTAEGTGDDSLAFFNASGRVDHVKIADSFARGILLFNSPGVSLDDVDVRHAPVLRR